MEESPGEYVLKTLFKQFTIIANRKINLVFEHQNKDKNISKVLRKGEDVNFDQLISSLGSVAENCLPSLLKTLLNWYEAQHQIVLVDGQGRLSMKINRSELADQIAEKRALSIDFIYCLVLIEVLKMLCYHPGLDAILVQLIDHIYIHFKYKDGQQLGDNAMNINIVADLYAELNGIIAESRFELVKTRFVAELKELRSQNDSNSQSIIALLMGMKFFRIKMHPIEDLHTGVQLLDDIGVYFLEVKDKDIKHALAGLFVEILLPVAAAAKNEVNVPVLKNFVMKYYSSTLDSCVKKKHSLALFPMVTCLLCISHKEFFLSNWSSFLTICLSRLKDKDPRMARVALESLYRLLWVYMVRIKCESNMATTSRLHSIMISLFPKGSKIIMPRETPLNIYVKIIQFIAQERLDFAMKEIIYDLLSVGKQAKIFAPERMSVGIRAFLVIADSLQQNEVSPPMPQTSATTVLPSGHTLRLKRKTYIGKHLSESIANMIGLQNYYSSICTAFTVIIKHLDSQVGKNLLITRNENVKMDEIITGDRKPKIDLFRTCVASIPRLLPAALSQGELVELLVSLTLHLDDELGKLSFQSLQNIIADLPIWRNSVIRGYIKFIDLEVTYTFTQLREQCTRRLITMLTQWRNVMIVQLKEKIELSPTSERRLEANSTLLTMQSVQAFALVLLCNVKPVIRKLAVSVLREVKALFPLLNMPEDHEPYLIDMIDKACPCISELLEKSMILTAMEKTSAAATSNVDFQWLIDRTSLVWYSSANKESTVIKESLYDPWIDALAIVMKPAYVGGHCKNVLQLAWPMLYNRLQTLFTIIDPTSTMVGDSRSSSLLRGSSKKLSTERDNYLTLWKAYVYICCCIAPTHTESRSISPDFCIAGDQSEVKLTTANDLFHSLISLLRSDSLDQIKETIVNGLGHSNVESFGALVEELQPLIKESVDRKQENLKRRRKRDSARLLLVQIFHLLAKNRIFGASSAKILNSVNGTLAPPFHDYIEQMRAIISEEKDSLLVYEIRLYYCRFVNELMHNIKLSERQNFLTSDLRYSLYNAFILWSKSCHTMISPTDKRYRFTVSAEISELDIAAIEVLASTLCCGPVFDASSLSDDGYCYNVLTFLLKADSEKLNQLGERTLSELLYFNADSQILLEWTIDQCYTRDANINRRCFTVLADVFNDREYPCDHISMLFVTLLYTGSVDLLKPVAIHLFHVLYLRFFIDTEDQESKKTLLSGPSSKNQYNLVENLSKLHPEITMPIFSEISHRLQTASTSKHQRLLRCLPPWMKNCVLVNHDLVQSKSSSQNIIDSTDVPEDGENNQGMVQVTEMVLNNLFYMTYKLGAENGPEIKELWAGLVSVNQNNLSVIVHYLITLLSLSVNTILQTAQQIILYVSSISPNNLMEELMYELNNIESLPFVVEYTPAPPFFRRINHRKITVSNSASSTLISLNKYKRNSAENDVKISASTPNIERAQSTSSLLTGVSTTSGQTRLQCTHTSYVYTLPMPAYGGHFSPLSELLQHEPNALPLQRCNIALMLFTEIILVCDEIDFKCYLAKILHIATLGLENAMSCVHDYSKQMLVNLVLLYDPSLHIKETSVLKERKMEDYPTEREFDFPKLSDTDNEDVHRSREYFINFLLTSRGTTLWRPDDLYTRTPPPPSNNLDTQITLLVKYLLHIFNEKSLKLHWSREALNLALSSSVRQYASRSFQVFRILKEDLSKNDICDLLSRLLETISEISDETQSYVIEILETLISSVDCIQTPGAEASVTRVHPENRLSYYGNAGAARPLHELKDVKTLPSTSPSSSSSSSHHHPEEAGNLRPKDDVRFQLFWISVSILNSAHEYEFLLALELMEKILDLIDLNDIGDLDTLEKTFSAISWPNFVDIQSLLFKGCSSSVTYEKTWTVISRFTKYTHLKIVSHIQNNGFAMNVFALLPKLITNYNKPTEKCIQIAITIKECAEKHFSSLDNLQAVMDLYSTSRFAKDSLQWTKCVVIYLQDLFSEFCDDIITFVVQMLEDGSNDYKIALLQILYCLFECCDITSSDNSKLTIQVVSKYIQTSLCEESLRLLKLCVNRSSSIQDSDTITPSVDSKRLPGPTLEFTISQSELIVAQLGTDNDEVNVPETFISSQWKKHLNSQTITRNQLMNLLKSYGPRHTTLPTSSSVIFSYDSDTLEKQASLTNSSDDRSLNEITADLPTNTTNSSTDNQIQVLDDAFDFLYDDDQATNYEFGGLIRDHSLTSSGSLRPSLDPADHQPTTSAAELINENSTIRASSYPRTSGTSSSLLDSSDDESMNDDLHELNVRQLSANIREKSMSSVASVASDISNLSDEIIYTLQDLWQQYITSIISDESNSQINDVFIIYPQLFQESIEYLGLLTKVICSYLSQFSGNIQLSNQFAGLFDSLSKTIKHPIIYIDGKVLEVYAMKQSIKFHLIKIHESFETFNVQRHLVSCSVNDFHSDEINNIAHSLYRLFYELVQIEDAYRKLCSDCVYRPQITEIEDISEAMTTLKRDLDANDTTTSTTCETCDTCVDLTETSIFMSAVLNRKYSVMFAYARQMRTMNICNNDIISIMIMYCLQKSKQTPGVLMYCQSKEVDLQQICIKLLDIKININKYL